MTLCRHAITEDSGTSTSPKVEGTGVTHHAA